MDDAVSGGRVDEKLEAVRDAVLRRNPGEPEFQQAVQRGTGDARAGGRQASGVRPGQADRADLRARAPDHLPGAVEGRPWRGADQPRLPRRVQQRARALQGRAAVPPVGEPRHREVPRVRADVQERAHRHADRRRQGRRRLRPEGPLGRRDHALLPELHDRAVPPPRRVHRRARRRHRRRRPRDRLPVRPVQAHHEPLRVRRADRQGPRLGRRAGAHGRPPATAAPTSSRRCWRPRGRASTARRASSPGAGNVAIHAIEKVQQLGGTVVACSDSTGYVHDDAGHRSRRCSSRSSESSAARIAATPNAAAVAPGSCPTRPSGTFRATSRCRAPRRTSSTGTDAAHLVANGLTAVGEGANMPCTPECRSERLPSRGRGLRPRARRPTPAAWRPARSRCSRTRPATPGPSTTPSIACASIMRKIHSDCRDAADGVRTAGDYLAGANIVGFTRVARAMLALGLT